MANLNRFKIDINEELCKCYRFLCDFDGFMPNPNGQPWAAAGISLSTTAVIASIAKKGVPTVRACVLRGLSTCCYRNCGRSLSPLFNYCFVLTNEYCCRSSVTVSLHYVIPHTVSNTQYPIMLMVDVCSNR